MCLFFGFFSFIFLLSPWLGTSILLWGLCGNHRGSRFPVITSWEVKLFMSDG